MFDDYYKEIEMKKYYHISYRININGQTPLFGHELIDITPTQYVLKWMRIGGHYGQRVILFAQEITEDEYLNNFTQFNKT